MVDTLRGEESGMWDLVSARMERFSDLLFVAALFSGGLRAFLIDVQNFIALDINLFIINETEIGEVGSRLRAVRT